MDVVTAHSCLYIHLTQDQNTPLILAAQMGNLECLRLLVAGGANIDCAEKNVRDALGLIPIFTLAHILGDLDS